MTVEPRLIRAIQACRRKVAGLEEDAAWRDFLDQATSKRSLRAMIEPELGRVLDALHGAGAPRLERGRRGVRQLAEPQQRMIRGLWIELHRLGAIRDGSEMALASFIKRQTGVEALQWLEPHESAPVVEALKSMVRRSKQRIEEARNAGDLRARCEALWQQLRELGAVTYEQADLARFGYSVTGKAAFHFYEDGDFVHLIDRLEGWAAHVRKQKARLQT